MIYDHYLTIYDLAGSPLSHKLTINSAHFYAPMEVYHARFWEGVQAGSRIDMMVQIPFGRDISATQYAIPEDGHVYRIIQAQHGTDSDELPVTTLSLQREEGFYEICRPENAT